MMPGSDAVHGAEAFARDLVPVSLRERPQWVCWRYINRAGKATKCPINPRSGRRASSADPSTWSSFDEAVAAWQRDEECAGVGFVFSADDPFTGIDLDDCLDEHGDLLGEARQIVGSLNSYTEVSPSGRGVKIFIEGRKPVGSRSRSKKVAGFKEIEIYSEKRFFTVTGRRVPNTPLEITDRQRELDELCHRLWPKKRLAVAGSDGEAGIDGDDNALIEKAKDASNGDRFRGLWSGDTSAHRGDHSAADLGLCSHLAFWTGRNPERMDRLFRQSGLLREKWDEQRGDRTYGRMTIDAAIADCTEVYQPPQQTRPDVTPTIKSTGQTQATRLINLVRASGAELFHDVEGTAFASVPVEKHREIWPIRNRGFRQWIAHTYYRKHDGVPNTQALGDALGVLEGEACYGGPEHDVFVRVGAIGDAGDANFAIFLDLADPAWRAVRIDATGWAIVDRPPVRFRRPRGMHPLPAPERGGTIDELHNYVNVDADGDFALIVSWLVAAYWPSGPYPILALHGEQGSAKSTLARLLRSLIDPNAAPLRSSPREVRDLMIAAQNGWALVFDNLSRIKEWTSDALCRMSTGGGFSTRELYTDADEVILEATRPMMLTGITELGDREDLLDRTIQVVLPTIPEQRRRTERDLWAGFEPKRPQLLGAMLDAVSLSVRNAAEVRLDVLPRMADFAVRAVAAEPAMPWPEGTFLRAYADVRSAGHELAIEASSVGQAVLAWMEDRSEWSGTSTALLATLEEYADEKVTRRRDWPKRPRDLSAALRRLAPTLRALELEVEFPRSRRARSIQIRKCGRLSVISASSVTTGLGAPENASTGDAEVTLGDAGMSANRFAASPRNRPLAPEKPVGDAGDADDADRRPLSADAKEEVELVL